MCTLTKPAGQSYYTDAGGKIFVSAYTNLPLFPAPPVVNWTQRQIERGSWSCTNGHSLTAASFNLTGTSYTCTTESGTIAWNGTTALGEPQHDVVDAVDLDPVRGRRAG